MAAFPSPQAPVTGAQAEPLPAIVESAFGGGHFKSVALAKAFRESKELVVAIGKCLQRPTGHVLTSSERYVELNDKCRSLTTDQYIEEIIGLRGYLHHHDAQRGGIWHPDGQNRFEVAASLLGDVCFEIAMQWVNARLFSSETRRRAAGVTFRWTK